MARRQDRAADLHQQIRDLKNQLFEARSPLEFELQRREAEIAKLGRELAQANADRECLVEALDALVAAVFALRRDAKKVSARMRAPLL